MSDINAELRKILPKVTDETIGEIKQLFASDQKDVVDEVYAEAKLRMAKGFEIKDAIILAPYEIKLPPEFLPNFVNNYVIQNMTQKQYQRVVRKLQKIFNVKIKRKK